MFTMDVIQARTVREIKTALKAVLATRYADRLPADRQAPILLKPNFNSNMNALTGNTTDLRVLAAVIEFLKDRGHTHLTIGEGTNSGYYRHRISVIARLAADRLAAYYGVAIKDLNYAEPVWIDFANGVKAGVARECLEAACLINLPKLKTHFEAGMSVCLKNLMGCLVGQENKKKIHQALAANILNLNRGLKPHLHIVDAVIAMEGLGPTRGTPVGTGLMIVGDDPLAIDLLCARLAGFPYRRIRPLAEAERQGLLTEAHQRFVRAFPLARTFAFAPPKAGPIASFIHDPRRQRYFLAIRNLALFRYLCTTRLGGKLLYATGLRQDVFIDDNMKLESLQHDVERCRRCGRCAAHCPIELDLPDVLNDPERMRACIGCVYCYCVCSERAIRFLGAKGFLAEQDRQYAPLVTAVAARLVAEATEPPVAKGDV